MWQGANVGFWREAEVGKVVCLRSYRPADRGAALNILRQARDLGITFIETADSYGLFVSEDLNREARHPYDGIDSAPMPPPKLSPA